MSAALPHALRVLADQPTRVWLVGGAVRDRLLGRETLDYDLAIEGDAQPLARALGRAADGHAFLLSEEFGAWRVKGRSEPWQVDITPLAGDSIEQDLRRRDLTINAIATRLEAGAELLDPCGGAVDIEAGRLRAVGERSFSDDPLRVLRLARFAAELGFAADSRTEALAAASASQLPAVAGERVFQELRALVCARHVLAGLELASRIGAGAAVLPELEALRGVGQSDYHHLDVYDHTLATLGEVIALEAAPGTVFEADAAQLRAILDEPLANELTRGQALRFGALLHDIAKPLVRAVGEQGRVTFHDHDRIGAQMCATILQRLRASDRLIEHVAALTRHHLRLGFLVHEQPLARRSVYRYMSTCSPVEVDVSVLSVADRLATLGRNSERAVAAHLALARELMPDAITFRARPPRPPLRGDQLARALGIEPGPLLGQLLAELTEASFAGELQTSEQAVEHARAQLARLGGGDG